MNNSELEKEKKAFSAESYIVFSAGGEQFAIPLLRIREVIACPAFTPLPNMPNYFKGIANLRGKLISIFGFKEKMSISEVQHINSEEAVIVLDFESNIVGFIVDSVDKVIKISSEIPGELDIPLPTAESREFIQGVYSDEGKIITLINIDHLLNSKEVHLSQRRSS